MTNTEMLAKLRSFLDEATADLYIDATELYPALTEAQKELVKTISDAWYDEGKGIHKRVPKAVMPLVSAVASTIASGSNSFALATIVVPVSMKWNPDGAVADGKQCTFGNSSGEFLKLLDNSLLAGGSYCWWDGVNVYVNPVSAHASAGYSLGLITEPTDIDASTQPVTDEVAHDAIVERACWILLKDRESQQAQVHLQMYGALLQGLMK